MEVDIIPPPTTTLLPPLPLPSILTALALGIELISRVVHSRPLARKRRLVTGRRYFVMSDVPAAEAERGVMGLSDREEVITSMAMTGCTWELWAKVNILVAVTLGNEECAAALLLVCGC